MCVRRAHGWHVSVGAVGLSFVAAEAVCYRQGRCPPRISSMFGHAREPSFAVSCLRHSSSGLIWQPSPALFQEMKRRGHKRSESRFCQLFGQSASFWVGGMLPASSPSGFMIAVVPSGGRSGPWRKHGRAQKRTPLAAGQQGGGCHALHTGLGGGDLHTATS